MKITDDLNRRRDRAAWWAIVLLALVVRLGWGLTRPTSDAAIAVLPDQAEYLQLGRSLLLGKGLAMVDPHFGDTVYAYRMPGYPMFIAACGGKPLAVRLVQGVLDTGTAIAVYLLARRWLDRRGTMLAMGLVAVNPFLIYFSGLILSETLFTAMLAWSLVLLSAAGASDKTIAGGDVSDTRRTALPLLGVLVAAFSVLVKPSAAALVVILAIAVGGLNRKRGGAYPRWWPLPPATTGLLMVLLVLLPWASRNHRVLGPWIWTATDAGATLYDGFNDRATGASDQSHLALIPGLRMGTEVQRNQYLCKLAWKWAIDHPSEALRLGINKMLRTWSPMPLSDDNGTLMRRASACVYSLPFFLLVLLGLRRAGGQANAPTLAAKTLLLLPAIYFTLVHAVSIGSLRYRIPCEAPMAVLAASGLIALLSRWSMPRKNPQ